MSRRTERMAQDAAQQASEAARVLQQRGQEVKQEQVEPEGEKKQIVPVTPRNEAHTKAHEEIEQRYLQTLGVNEDGSPIEKVETEETTEAEPSLTPVAVEPPIAVEPKKIRVKVDGEEYDELESVVEDHGGLKAYQITKASENRLKKANEALTEIRKRQDELAQFAMKQFEQMPQQTQITNDQLIAQKLDAIRYGTPEEGAAALNEILQKTQQKFDPNLMTAQAVAQMTRKLAVDKFREEFSDIVTNPDLLQFAVTLEHKELQAVQPQAMFNMDWTDHYRKIGNKIRSIVGKPNQPAQAALTQGTTSQSSEKEVRKASITVLPTAASARATTPVEKELTPEEARKKAIAEMQGLNRKLKGETG
jgi:hypothetical protein